MKRATAVLVLLVGLTCLYSFVSKEQPSVPTPVAFDQKPARDVAPSDSDPARKRQAVPAQIVNTSDSISSRPHQQSVPATTASATAPAPALNPVALRTTAAPERVATSAQAAQIAEDIPLEWGITGSNTEGYELRAERAVVLSGSASAVLESHADTDTSRFGALFQVASAVPFRGKRLELSGYIASVDAPAGASIWLRADDATAATVAFDNSGVRGIRGTAEWTYQNIVIEIPKEAVALIYGAVLNGRGKLYVDDLQFRVVDESVTLTAKPIAPQRGQGRAALVDPGRAPRNLDFEETQIKKK